MDSPPFGVQTAVAGGDLPEEWQALFAHQAAVLVALLSRMRTAAAAMRQAPAERVLTTQAQGKVNVAQDGCNESDQRRRWRLPAVGGQGRRVLGDQQPSRDQTGKNDDHTPRSSKGLGTPWPPCCTTWV